MKIWLSEHKKSIFWSTVATLLPMVIGCIIWDQLPETMAIHWGVDGVADGYGSRGTAVFLLNSSGRHHIGLYVIADKFCPLGKTLNLYKERIVHSADTAERIVNDNNTVFYTLGGVFIFFICNNFSYIIALTLTEVSAPYGMVILGMAIVLILTAIEYKAPKGTHTETVV